jgi:class 3 adenylate cyclase
VLSRLTSEWEVADFRPYRAFIPLKWVSIAAVPMHLLVTAFFWWLGADVLVYVNFVSIPLYLLVNRLNQRGLTTLAFGIGMTELLVHQVLCAHFAGWESGFQYYVLCVAFFAFFIPMRSRFLNAFWFLLSLSTFVAIDMRYNPGTPYYALDPGALRVMYFVNVCMAMTAMGIIAFYYSWAADKAEEALAAEHRKSEALLRNILPAPIVARLKAEGRGLSDGFEGATILFADIVGFTSLCERVPPRELTHMLNRVFSVLDDLVERHGLEKIKTIGDAYMVASGVPEAREDHAAAMAELALEIRKTARDLRMPDGRALSLRIGMNSGPVVAGVIGKKKFIYDLWGDTVNTASRMESHGVPGEIQVSQASHDLLCGQYVLEARGEVDVKGKGKLPVWLLKGQRPVSLDQA